MSLVFLCILFFWLWEILQLITSVWILKGPFDKVDIKVLSVEIIHGGERGDGPNDMDDYMKSQGYTFYGKQSYDHMFVKNDLI